MEYVIDKREYIKFESDIVVSGCVRGLAIPKIYETNENIYLVYENHEPAVHSEITQRAIEEIKKNVEKYMLNPSRIIFHPSCISKAGGILQFHYLPSKRSILYGSDDLVRYLLYNQISGTGIYKKDDNTSEGVLYFKNNGTVERLLLKHTLIGNSPKCSIKLNFDGLVKLSSRGKLVVQSGDVSVNGNIIQKTVELNKGDTIRFGEIEAVYW